MNFVLDRQPWDVLLDEIKGNETVSALQLLTALEQADEEETELFLDDLAEKRVCIDLQALPKLPGNSASAARLQFEEKVAKQGLDLKSFEENDPLRLYLEELQSIPEQQSILTPKTPEEKRQFTDAMLHKTAELAREYVGMGVLLLDLIQEANLGLWQGIQTFEEGDILAHCQWWSRHYLDRCVLMQAKAAGVGQKLRQAMEDYRSVDERLLTELGRNPTPEEMADAMHMSLQETEAVAEMIQNARLLYRVKTPEPADIPQEEDQAVEDTAYFQMRQRIAELLSALPEDDAKLLSLRYGLEGGVPLQPEQVAQRLGITVADVTAREAAALAQLRTNK